MGKHKTVFTNAINPANIINYWNGMVNDFGMKFTILCISNYFGIKGALNTFIGSVQTGYWTEGGWTSLDYGNAAAIAKIPWSIKGFGGLLTDLFPIFGYEKTSYMYIYCSIGTVACIVMGSFSMTKETVNIIIPTFMFLFLNFQTSFSDLLMEGKYVDLMKNNPNNKGNVISFTYFCVTLGSIFPSGTVGVMTDSDIPVRFQFFVYLPFAAQILPFIWFGCMVQDKADPKRNNRFDFHKLNNQRHISFLAFMMGIAGCGTVIVGIFGNTTMSFVYNLTGGFVIGIIAWFTLPHAVAKILYYVYIAMFSYINLDSHLEYFYTLDDRCIEGGPNFDFTYYKTWVGYVSIVANFIGIWLFQAVLCQYKFRPIFWSSTIIRVAGSIVDIIIINRWNNSIGINDKTMFMIGSAIIYSICFQLDYMPIALMCAKVCPKSVETIMFSVVAGYGNYGAAVGAFVGNQAIAMAGVNLVAGGPCNHDNLAWIVFAGHCIAPLMCIPFTFLLIPDKAVNDNFADPSFRSYKHYKFEEQVDATSSPTVA